MDKNKQKSRVNSIHRAAGILACLINENNSVTEIAKSCKLSKSTVHRLLKSMEESDFVSQDPLNRQYYLGHLFTRLASSMQISHGRLVSCAIEEMKHLSNVTGETITLGIQLGFHHIRLNEIPSKHSLRVTGDDATTQIMFAGATGKVLLSQLKDDALATVMQSIKLERLTENTVIDKEIFLKQIKKVRDQGYAFSVGEILAGGVNISAPVKNYICPAFLSILGPQHRIEPHLAKFSNEIKLTAERISNNVKAIV